MSAVIGIDLGTSNSVVALSERGRVTIIADNDGNKIHPSAVAFMKDGSVLVGVKAKSGLAQRPTQTVVSAKRLIGRRQGSEQVREAQARMGYTIVPVENGVGVAIESQVHRLETISALILRHLRDLAESFLATTCDRAVITVPAYFDDNQRQATRAAAKMVGIEVMRIVNEPTAAAYAYGYGGNRSHRVAVYDLGGGTFDISVLELGEGALEVLSTGGDTFLGGDDFDAKAADLLAGQILSLTGRDPRQDPAARQRLLVMAEAMKCELSSAEHCEQDATALAGIPMTVSLTRADFEAAIGPSVDRTITLCEAALTDAGIHVSEVDGVVLVGGSTRIPAVRQAVTKYFRREPDQSIDPDLVVGVGAAMYAAQLGGKSSTNRVLLDVTPRSLRIGTVGGYTESILLRNSPIPTERSRLFSTARDGQEQVAMRIYQGESEEAAENVLLGEFLFGPLPPKPRGEVEIAVTFAIDPDGLVQVTARDLATGVAAAARINLATRVDATKSNDADLPAAKA